ncbi:uncharacterized protein K452DRAFT_280074 [Aplosporella prunicola CBS 121167]|uniref:Rhodopsin domain-containing protein n=1 Tax=Aplosporella prunicola CBS 121167 TaxID=1176127 RepID=A0A6A6B017_9PEZI|nr:uncharacterized protein K452DRAFT_280074 [Aplosporella prunicola CBS 121167]KAF2136377.1 hypothetical protein K452DRAFT_280074 [Aplosporella prunicola CBS 121167]
MATGEFGAPPGYVDLHENQTEVIYWTIIPVAVVGTGSVVLRFMARSMANGPGLCIDDVFIFLALVFTWVTAICCFLSIQYGAGRHLWTVSKDDFTMIWRILYAYVMIYATAVSCTKFSIVLFYRRIFSFTYGFWLGAFLAVSYWVVILVVINTGCRPFSYFFEQYTNPTAEGTCIDLGLFYYANAIWAMLVDVVILLMPLPTIWSLQLPTQKRAAVTVIFLLGAFVVGASIARIVTLKHFLSAKDLTWEIGAVFIWSCVEPFVGIVSACLPTFAPLMRRVSPSLKRRFSLLWDSWGSTFGAGTTSRSRAQSGSARRQKWGARGYVETVEGDVESGDAIGLTTRIRAGSARSGSACGSASASAGSKAEDDAWRCEEHAITVNKEVTWGEVRR